MICLPTSNCWRTTFVTPVALASLMTERILVPNTPCELALANRAANSGIGFIICAPSASPARPLSTFKNGMTPFSCHRYSAVPMPSIVRSTVISNKIAPRMRSPVNAGLLIILVRIACTRSNISSSLEYAVSSTPYNCRAFGVLPPLWSRAAIKPLPLLALLICSLFIVSLYL